MDGDTLYMKSVLFGFGMGMVFLSAIFLLAYRFESEQRWNNFSDDMIIQRAIELGMIWPEADISASETD